MTLVLDRYSRAAARPRRTSSRGRMDIGRNGSAELIGFTQSPCGDWLCTFRVRDPIVIERLEELSAEIGRMQLQQWLAA